MADDQGAPSALWTPNLKIPDGSKINPELFEIFYRTIHPYIVHIMANLSEDLAYGEKLQIAIGIFFGTDHRSVSLYTAQEEFIMQAPFQNEETTWDPNSENLRIVKKGDCLLLRTDKRTPWVVEIQVVKHLLDDSDDRRIFILSPTEFYSFRKKLKYVNSA